MAFFTFIPKLKAILPPLPTAHEQLEWQLRVMGLQFVLLTTYLGVLFLLRERDTVTLHNRLLECFPQAKVKKLKEDEFYADFLKAAKFAEHFVNIMYLAAYPPDEVQDNVRKDYYSEIVKVIKKRPAVRFRRVIRNSSKNREWISELVQELRDTSNADIAILKETEKEEMPLALSVQIVDNSKVWIVAIGSHERVRDFRDLFIENEDVALAMQQYYERIWQRSTKLLDSGRITDDGHKYLTAS